MATRQSTIRAPERTWEQIAELADLFGTQSAAIIVAVDRLYQAEIKQEEHMHIRVEYSEAALWGSADPEAEGIDERASASRFGDMLLARLRQGYPAADIDVEQSINDRHMVDGREDTDDAADVGEIIQEVWSSWEWSG